MADRVFGVVRGAGTQVREKEPQKEFVVGPLGTSIFMGVFERGAEDEISICPSNIALKRKMGGLLDDADFNARAFASLEAPLNAQHYYDHSGGNGNEFCLRTVPKTNDVSNDDRPTKSELLVFNRESTPKIIGTLVAHNGGRWGGQRKQYLGAITGTPGTDFPSPNQILLDGIVAKDFKRDEYKGAVLHIHGITTRTYTVVSNSSLGLFTLAADEDLVTDWAAAGPPANLMVTIYRDNLNYRGVEKYLSAEFKDGTLDRVGMFGLQVKVDGEVFLDWEELSMDINSPYYWKDVIESDPNNDLFTVTDSFTGNRLVASSRPANRYGLSDAITATQLTLADPFIYTIVSISGDWVPTITVDAFGSSVVPQRLKIEMTDVGAPDEFTLTTDIGNRSYVGILGTPLVTDNYMINITVNAGAGVYADTDYFYIYLQPLAVDELIGGVIVPDTTKIDSYKIVSNTRTTITVSAIHDMTLAGTLTGGEAYRIQWPERYGGGYDGYIAGMVTTDYETLLDFSTSPLLKLKSMNVGLAKMSIPGIAKPSEALALQKKARSLCLSYNWQYRVEIPDEYITEQSALNWINNSMGRLDLSVAFFPSFFYIRDPLANSGSQSREKYISVMGMHLGREAAVARQYDGYHKAEAGTTVTLPLITRSNVLGTPDNPNRLDEELLNPAGLNAYRWSSGGSEIIVWGDRTLDITTTFKFKHKRELMSHYSNLLLENFDFAIFEINDPIGDAPILASVHSFFLSEFIKRAIRGNSFVGGRNPAAVIKMDSENNTEATRAQGKQNVAISLRLADTVEQLQFVLSAIGVTEIR